ncbi:MAG: DUF4129 domain-containing protein [Synechococcales cyanobacterium T60_A2020_003]|nr:DUF4129 domain-containing protein [Synechococcales cyanobacterium T60_A2020_003]
MAAGEFQEHSIPWEIQKFSQRVGEGFEGLWGGGPDIPNPSAPPEWISRLLFWIILTGMVIIVGRWLYLLLRPYMRPFLDSLFPTQLQASEAVTPSLTMSDWLTRSRQAQQRGQYGEACHALYMAVLHHLDQQNLIPLDPSRTDGEYLSLTCHLDRPNPYQFIIRTHERLRFGQAQISAEECDRCWQAYDELNRP